jgi:hypothetical protein
MALGNYFGEWSESKPSGTFIEHLCGNVCRREEGKTVFS